MASSTPVLDLEASSAPIVSNAEYDHVHEAAHVGPAPGRLEALDRHDQAVMDGASSVPVPHAEVDGLNAVGDEEDAHDVLPALEAITTTRTATCFDPTSSVHSRLNGPGASSIPAAVPQAEVAVGDEEDDTLPALEPITVTTPSSRSIAPVPVPFLAPILSFTIPYTPTATNAHANQTTTFSFESCRGSRVTWTPFTITQLPLTRVDHDVPIHHTPSNPLFVPPSASVYNVFLEHAMRIDEQPRALLSRPLDEDHKSTTRLPASPAQTDEDEDDLPALELVPDEKRRVDSASTFTSRRIQPAARARATADDDSECECCSARQDLTRADIEVLETYYDWKLARAPMPLLDLSHLQRTDMWFDAEPVELREEDGLPFFNSFRVDDVYDLNWIYFGNDPDEEVEEDSDEDEEGYVTCNEDSDSESTGTPDVDAPGPLVTQADLDLLRTEGYSEFSIPYALLLRAQGYPRFPPLSYSPKSMHVMPQEPVKLVVEDGLPFLDAEPEEYKWVDFELEDLPELVEVLPASEA